MTMQHLIHPDDERLAALAGGDPELEADTELRAHVSSCDACRAIVDDLSLLRTALAELPDLVPSRPLQLVPPVADPRAAHAAGWLRRLSAPIMAAGLGLVLVGAVGTSGVLNFASASGERQAGAQAAQPSSQDAREGTGGGSVTESPQAPATRGSFSTADGLGITPSPSVRDNGSESAASPSAAVPQPVAPSNSATPTDAGLPSHSPDGNQPTAPWLVLLLAGVAFVLTGGVLRFAVPQN